MAVEEQLGLREVLELAQTALEDGRHQEASVACRHVLRDYPDSITAMRLLGESYLEAGRADEAGRAFEKVLAIDPFNVLARVGLGVLAEDRGEDERAIGHFRLAWEAAPTLPQLRSELVRLYRKRYGVGGRLRMTRIALANLHARNEDLPRAIRQFQLLHQEEPARLDVTVGLMEARWRHGDDDEAVALCRAILAERPRVARALLILAAIGAEGRGPEPAEGEHPEELLTSVRAFDPDAVLTRDLVALRPAAILQRFIDAPATMTPFDPSVLEVAGTDELLGKRTSTLGEEAFRWEDVAGGLTGESSLKHDTGEMGAAGKSTNGLPPMPSADDDVEALFAAIDRQLATVNADADEISFVAPTEEEIDQVVAEASDTGLLPDWGEAQDDEMTPDPDEPSAVERLTANWENIDNELAAARPSDDAPVGVTGMLSALGDLEVDLKPFDVESDAEPELEQTLSFDPSKFSLPPLDGEDDDDLTLTLETGDLGDEIAPFSLDETGPKVKTGGLTFADLVRNEQNAPTSYAAGNSFADDPADDDAPLADIASIFVTRELTPLPEDRLLDVQATAGEPASPPIEPDIAPFAPPAEAATPAPHVPTTPAATTPEQPVAKAPEPPRRAPESAPAISFEALLNADAPRLEVPEATFYPDATRPLLADDTALLDSPELLATSGGATAEESDAAGMDNLFSRLRHRKQERIETGDLQINRRLKGPQRPALIAPDEAPEASAPAQADTSQAAGAKPTTDPFTPLTPEAASLDDWIMSLAPIDLPEPTRANTATDESTTVSGDDWLAGLVEGSVADAPAWDPPLTASETTPERPEVAVNGTANYDRWDFPPLDELPGATTATQAEPVVLETEVLEDVAPATGHADMDWLESAPEQPEPFATWHTTDAMSAGGQPSWADELPEQPAASDRLLTTETTHRPPTTDFPVQTPATAPTNGHHAEVADRHVAPATIPPRPVPVVPSAAPEQPRVRAQRQTEQLVALETMVAADPQNHFARLTLAIAYGASRPEQALNEYRRLIKLSDELVPEVIERLKEMIADGDAPPRAHRILGDAYMKLGQFDMAMGEFQRALSTRSIAMKA